MNKDSPSQEGYCPLVSGLWILCGDVSELSVSSIFIVGVSRELTPPMNMEQSVPKRRYIKFRPQGITQKKEHNIQNTARVWNQVQFWPAEKFHSES
jgi:hypothetical protein